MSGFKGLKRGVYMVFTRPFKSVAKVGRYSFLPILFARRSFDSFFKFKKLIPKNEEVDDFALTRYQNLLANVGESSIKRNAKKASFWSWIFLGFSFLLFGVSCLSFFSGGVLEGFFVLLISFFMFIACLKYRILVYQFSKKSLIQGSFFLKNPIFWFERGLK